MSGQRILRFQVVLMQNPDCGKLYRINDQVSSINKLHKNRKRRNIVVVPYPSGEISPFLESPDLKTH